MDSVSEVDKLDVAKIHAEINQIRNQQFLITIAALSFVGVSAAWLLPEKSLLQGSVKVGAAGFAFALSIGLLFILGLLFFWMTRLSNMIARMSTYLASRDLSNWETLHALYVQTYPADVSQRGTMAKVFLLLGAASFSLPVALVCFGPYAFIPTAPIEAQTWYLLLILVSLFYLFSVTYLGFRNSTEDRLKFSERWRTVILKGDA